MSNVVNLYDQENDTGSDPEAWRDEPMPDQPEVTLDDLLALLDKANAVAQQSLAILRSLSKELL